MCLNCGVGFSVFTKNSGRTPGKQAKISDRPTARFAVRKAALVLTQRIARSSSERCTL
jgi:hypothetical protein